MQENIVVASASGKVLIVGGYAVLERPNPGLVLATSAQFHSSVGAVKEKEAMTMKEEGKLLFVEMVSPQLGQSNKYVARPGESGGVVLVPKVGSETQPKNRYVEDTILLVLTFLRHNLSEEEMFFSSRDGRKLTIRLEADNDFYSQQARLREMKMPLTRESLSKLEAFLPCMDSANIAKTGLGSSAAMIVSLVSAILQFFASETGRKPFELEVIHRLGQLAHSIVQGKIGSGFDVCAATFGSMIYVRYDPKVLAEAMSATSNSDIVAKCVNISNTEWDQSVEMFKLPAGMELLCGDVCGGSETPSMSRQILQWRQQPGSAALWQSLLDHNQQVISLFSEISKSETYGKEFEVCKALPAREWPSEFLLKKLHDLFQLVRGDLKKMGVGANVPVEPDVQTKLCDGTIENNCGVLACGVPGAGGFDAVFAIVLGAEARLQVEQYWEQYGGVVALLLSALTPISESKRQKI